MFNNIQIQAIKAALAVNELGDKNPYQVCFAELGSSGASFGVCQGDAAANKPGEAFFVVWEGKYLQAPER